MRRETLDLGIDSALGQPAWCRARPTSIDGDLENIRWTHDLGGESLPAASYGLFPNLKKRLLLAVLLWYCFDSAALEGFFMLFSWSMGGCLLFCYVFRLFGSVFSIRYVLALPDCFLGPGWGWFLGISSCPPPRSVSGLVWEIGPLICGTRHVSGVVVWV